MSDSSDSGCPRGVWSDSSSDSDDGPSLRQRRDAWADRIDALRAAYAKLTHPTSRHGLMTARDSC